MEAEEPFGQAEEGPQAYGHLHTDAHRQPHRCRLQPARRGCPQQRGAIHLYYGGRD